ncbi:uncharacterized protein LY79DRAFT_656116 [Colletotrichum navitas]|uniref:Uncharacterized protein n=1 Tax=Colletotrichum navitas TaxID=681940 RepID=A0AAD8VAS5_9PEZI|nr:uncharacterized protein LY79DRAFT_656116 [Colletotrichum navitas]KAK1598428.1 hypothetical protein LY79DRAFT_656116 [Colletotrichum navitas]
MIDSRELETSSRQGGRPKVAYFFCEPPSNSLPLPVTATTVLAGLAVCQPTDQGIFAWLLSGNWTLSVENQVKASAVLVRLDSMDVIAAAGLKNAMQSITNATSACKSSSPPNLKKFDPSLLWFRYYANGVVLWVRLIVDRLLRLVKVDGLKAMSRTNLLRAMPDEIDDLYRAFIYEFRASNSIEKMKDMGRVLEWIIGCRGWTELQLQHLWRAIALPDNEHEYGNHETIAKNRFEFTSWDGFCSNIRHCCGPLIEILEDPQTAMDMNSPSHKAAQPTWTVQLSHQTVRTFLRGNSRMKELFVDPDSAERLVVTKLYRYLGIAMVPQSLEFPLRRRSFYKKSPLASLEERFSELPRHSFDEEQLLATHDYCKERPLAGIALEAVRQSQADRRGFVDALHIIGTNCLASKDCFPIYGATDMCFKPAYLGSNVAEFTHYRCLHGMQDALESFFDLLEKFEPLYSRLTFASSLKVSHQHQIVRGAIEALLEVNGNDNNHQACHFRVANALHDLSVGIGSSEADNCSNGTVYSDDLQPDPLYLRFFGDFISQTQSTHECTAPCRHYTHKARLLDGKFNPVRCRHFTQALETVVDRIGRTSELWHRPPSYRSLDELLDELLNEFPMPLSFVRQYLQDN